MKTRTKSNILYCGGGGAKLIGILYVLGVSICHLPCINFTSTKIVRELLTFSIRRVLRDSCIKSYSTPLSSRHRRTARCLLKKIHISANNNILASVGSIETSISKYKAKGCEVKVRLLGTPPSLIPSSYGRPSARANHATMQCLVLDFHLRRRNAKRFCGGK